jgi:hypothetical protein
MNPAVAPIESIETIIEKTRDRPPRKCHTVDHRGWAYCGAFGPGDDPRGELHSDAECRAKGHRRCVVCEELSRQLGGKRMVA